MIDTFKHSHRFSPALRQSLKPALVLGLSFVVIALSGCANKIVRADPVELPRAEARAPQEVRTPLPPPQIEPGNTQEPIREASPRFPRIPDWNTTFWDISSP